MNTKIISIAIALSLGTFSTSCQKSGFSSDNSSSCVSADCLLNSGQNTGTTTGPDFSQIDGAVNSNKSETNGFVAFSFDKKTGEFIVSVPLPGSFFITTQGSIRQLPGARWLTTVDSMGKPRLAVRLPASLLIKGVNFLPPATLPNGDPLPMTPGGHNELPSLAVELPSGSEKTQLYIYIGVNAVALYVTLPGSFNIPIQWNHPIRNKDRTRIMGWLTYVPPKLNSPSGIFLSSTIPPELAKALEDYLGL